MSCVKTQPHERGIDSMGSDHENRTFLRYWSTWYEHPIEASSSRFHIRGRHNPRVRTQCLQFCGRDRGSRKRGGPPCSEFVGFRCRGFGIGIGIGIGCSGSRSSESCRRGVCSASSGESEGSSRRGSGAGCRGRAGSCGCSSGASLRRCSRAGSGGCGAATGSGCRNCVLRELRRRSRCRRIPSPDRRSGILPEARPRWRWCWLRITPSIRTRGRYRCLLTDRRLPAVAHAANANNGTRELPAPRIGPIVRHG